MQSYAAGPVEARQARSVATRNGTVAGLALGILSLPFIALGAIGSAGRPSGNGLGALFLLIALVVCALVGFLASRHNGLIRSGVWAGFLGALITSFIALCLGTVIVILLTPTTLLLAHAAHPGAHPAARAALGRLAVARALLGVVGLLLAGLIGGLIGGLLGRLAHPRGDGGMGAQSAPYIADPAGPTREYTAPPQPVSPLPTPPTNTPPLYYPPATPFGADTPASRNDGQG